MLLIDMGNSYIKWQVDEQGSQRQGSLSYAELKANPNFVSSLGLGQKKCMIASVVGREALEGEPLAGFEQVSWLLKPQADMPLFQHCYANPERLGVDRWLNMIGARSLQSKPCPALVVSAGTALTLDLFNQDNQHEGGWIVPGIEGAQSFLFNKTNNVNAYDDEQDQARTSLEPGRSTTQAVASGAHRMSLAIVQSVHNDYPEYELFITGGNGSWLAKELEASYYPNLIFSGMSKLCAGYLSL